jgi:hypothetical protein
LAFGFWLLADSEIPGNPKTTKKSKQQPPCRVTFYFGDNMTREEVISAIQECNGKLGHAPSLTELQKLTRIGKRAILTNFGSYGKALRACGLEREGAGYEVSQKLLFLDWAGLARQLGKIPSINE